jgi:hypothetical protein
VANWTGRSSLILGGGDVLVPLPPIASLNGVLSRLGIVLVLASLLASVPAMLDLALPAKNLLNGLARGLQNTWSPIVGAAVSKFSFATLTSAVGLGLIAAAESGQKPLGSPTPVIRLLAIGSLVVLAAVASSHAFGRPELVRTGAPILVAGLLAATIVPPANLLARLVTIFSWFSLVVIALYIFGDVVTGTISP